MFGKRIGIDLGTVSVLVYEKGKGIVINEPSVVAVAQHTNTIVAVGEEAREMIGRAPAAIEVIRPMRDGVIADYLTTEAMLRYFIGKVIGRFHVKPEVMICVPVGVTGVEQRAVQDAAEAAGARHPAHIIGEPLAAAIGARMPIGSAQGHMVIDIGGGRTEAAIISMYGIVVSESVRVAGDRLNDAIAAHIKRRHNLVIGYRTADELKIAIGNALPPEGDEAMDYEVRGRDQITGLPKTVSVSASDVYQSYQDQLDLIVGAARSVFERTPPELSSDVVDKGIVLTGGGALLRNIDRLFTQEIGISCYVAENPMDSVAIGSGMALDHLELIKRSQPLSDEWSVSL